MRFLIDCQLPRALAERLRQMGDAADCAAAVGLGGQSDRAIWSFAIEHGAVIVSKDEDFATMAKSTNSGPTIIWVRLGNTRDEALLQTFEVLLPAVVKAFAGGNERLIELR